MSRLMINSVADVDESLTLEPDPDLTVGEGELLVEMEAATINLTDFRFAAGTYTDRIDVTLPSPIGGEGVGRVTEAGPGTDSSLVGHRVVILPTYEQGTWADRTVVAERNVVPVDDDGDVQQLCMLPINPPTAYHLLTRYVSLEPGDWVGQDMGNSAVGKYVIALARHFGAKTLSVVRREDTVAELRALGADLVLVDGDDLKDRIADALGGASLRLVLDGVGGTVAGDLAHALEFGGQVVSYSSLTRTPVAVQSGDLVYRELGLRGYWLINWVRSAPRAEILSTYRKLEGLVRSGVISAGVAATYPLADFRDAFKQARQPQRSGKVLFTFDGASR
ncbi:MAG: zinc-dependent alcohol dehydrogenase family protein [Myxococcota bacterium]